MLTPAQLSSYRDDGFTIARGVLSEAEIVELRSACDELMATAKGFQADTFVGVTFFNIHRDANPFAKDLQQHAPVAGLLRRVTYPYALNQTLDRYRAHPRILACAAAILGGDLKQIVNQVNFNPPGSSTGWGWHQDYRFRKPGIPSLLEDFVQTIVAIDLCAPATGGLRLVPGSFKLGDLKLDLDNENAERQFDAGKAQQPEMRPGDLLIFNSHVIHGSTPNRSKNLRRVYINGYARATASIGMPVLQGGQPVTVASGKMEYEGDQESLPKASKY